jgi:hypothetical protein
MTSTARLPPQAQQEDASTPPVAKSTSSWRQVLALASGRRRHSEPVLPSTGGPAGNAELTAWLGLLVIALCVAELVTLISVRQLISWHIVIGGLLIVPALAKTATTGWRMVRYYSGNPAYVDAGPPPMPLRLLGPLVVTSTITLLGSGVLLVIVGEDTARQSTTLLGLSLSWPTLHQVAFACWAVVTGLHVLARFLLAVRLTREGVIGHVGTGLRATTAVAVVAASVLVSLWVLSAAGSWT